MLRRLAALVAIVALAAAYARPSPTQEPLPATVILVSLDGFWNGFLEYGETPVLTRLAAEGVRAEALIPVFPTRTFPSHYSMVTGLYAEHHGIVANRFYDPVWDATFNYRNRNDVEDGRWWGGEPLWVTAERQGQLTAAFFWVGSEAPIDGIQPTYWRKYDGRVPNADRVDQVLAWLDLPGNRRPTFITLYFNDVDDAAHDHGVRASETRAALRRVDAAIGRLVAGLAARRIDDQVNVIVVADHGMADTSPDRVIYLDDYIDFADVRIPNPAPTAHVWPNPGKEGAVYRALRAADARWTVFRKTDLPERFHYRAHRRIAPIVLLADDGWSIASRRRGGPARFRGATHGYDNRLVSMQAIFVARGPAFRVGHVVPPFESVHLYPLVCAVLDLEPAVNDGSLNAVRETLRSEP